MRAVWSELVLLYWSIGKDILERQERLGWGAGVIEQLASDQRLRYAQQALANGWSRAVLTAQIERGLFSAQGGAVTYFAATLPGPQSELAREALKDPYQLDFLGVADDAHERVIERGLVRHIRDFRLELGQGFAFVEHQVSRHFSCHELRLGWFFLHPPRCGFVALEWRGWRAWSRRCVQVQLPCSRRRRLVRAPGRRVDRHVSAGRRRWSDRRCG